MNYHPEYQDRIDLRSLKRERQREQMAAFLFVAIIYTAGLLSGWAITTLSTIFK